MNKDQKSQYIDDLAQDLSQANVFYLADTAGLTVETINQLRRRCFQQGITLRVVKNTLLAKAMERVDGRDYGQLPEVLGGPTSIMFSEVGNAPAKLIKEFRKKSEKPLLKGAYIEDAIFVGDNQLDMLVAIKSREELIGDIIGLLQSPAKNVISGLTSGGSKIAGILKTLEERA
ncbi:MAG: 50S ribosomal protein L10 [Candidatus Fluviicola riflensis]|nr:MAG: 50S ribosomal protein L10 [Candidatus Fluviicola riflensis]OGS76661.1 MAG: 50S ribosomal protein L10 [Candidatus Fluviicola riflensis]OGS82984.1 MAG: 50S ribosomal protein L10 [Fluviicola sp. RIFCSPHIGHO2_01_FULL_43_53]OGS88392.1 MAG: 50S ribosomal protein L10 [Fluviicola sp. RIFCSPHIGHO2_12_FULL_43_24]